MSEINVAIIIVNWNGYQDTIECCKSLEKINYKSFKVFIVDNGSTNESCKILRNFIDTETNIDIELLCSHVNAGFAAGNNIAIKRVLDENFKYIWLLNNDTVTDISSLTEMVNVIDQDHSIGIAGSKIYYYQSNKLWFAGGLVNTWTGNTKHIGWQQEDNGRYSHTKEVDYITGCSMIISREVIEQVGLLPEYYFLYFEETEYNLQVKKAGWRIVYVPKSKIYHKVSRSSGAGRHLNPRVNYYMIRNQYWMIALTQPKIKKIICFASIVAKACKSILKIFVKNENNKKERMKYIFKALKDCNLYKKIVHKGQLS
ncbi:MAG: glycosyltransferase family 2 protein [Sporolactobacillus sp.]